MKNMTPEEQALRKWGRGRAALGQQLRDPVLARQHEQAQSDDKRLLDQFTKLSERAEALHYLITITTPELRNRHYGQGKWARAGEFEVGEN